MCGDASSSIISNRCVNTTGIAMLKTAYVSVLSSVSAVTVAKAAVTTISMITAAVATSPV